ncbi:hypothetical protein ACMXYV_10295 [Neptuniibacter sp. SY11_33]|uniref:hypothetical protein n=1 Tax=Neptuniibacter sp. SY11_33 TaxID=3398215 RepID=UPI0039F557DD
MEQLRITNPRKDWVASEFGKLISEWEEWQSDIANIQDHEYDRNTQSSVFLDGEENMEKHSILQMKTITFLDNNFSGHWFIHGREHKNCDRTDLRLSIRVKHRLRDLREMYASIEYAQLTDSYWKQKAKEMIDKLAEQTPDKALEIATSYLKSPLDSDV